MKELVEHVRTIHFSLAILAVSLFLLIQRPPHAGFRKAVEDAEAIHELAESLRHEVAVGDVLRLVRGEPEFLRLRRGGREEWVQLPRTRYEGSSGGREPVLFNITLLSEFIQLWDSTMIFARRADLHSRGRLACDSGAVEYEVRPRGEAPKSGVAAFEWTGRDQAVYSDCTVSFERLDDRVVLTRRVVRDYYGRRQWPLDEFRAVFREIHDRIEKPEDWKLADLVAELRDRERFINNEPAGERLEIFGLDLPATVTTDISALFLLLCQFYLWAHLNELARLLERTAPGDWPTGYVGLYSHAMARIFCVSSAALAPALLLSAAAVQGRLRLLPYTGLRAAGALASVLLGFGLFRALRRTSKIDEQPAERGRAATA